MPFFLLERNISSHRKEWNFIRSMVVLAPDEDTARKIAQKRERENVCATDDWRDWTNPQYALCHVLNPDADPEVILVNIIEG